jgi:PAS domain S-box-containing protein
MAQKPTYEELKQRVLGLEKKLSDLKMMEEALRESEEKHRSILQNIEEGYFEVDIAGNFTFFNDSTAKIIGYPRDELMGTNNRQYTDEENAKKLYQTFNKVYVTGRTHKGFDWEFIRKDGSKGYIEASVSLRKDSEGQPIGFRGVVRDVSERKHTEKRVLKSEKRFRDLFNSISDLIYTHDLKGRFISLNPAMEKLFGYEYDELVGHKASDIMKPEFVHAFESEYLEPLKAQGYLEGITVYFKKNGEKSYIEYHSTVVHPDNGEPFVSGTGRDVTERILSERKVAKLQEQLTQALKMEAIGTLAGGIAHDFNNILFPMFGYLEMMLEDVPKESPLRGHLVEVFSGAKRARDLIKQILTFSRQSDHERKPLETQRVIKEALKLIKSSLPTTIEISKDIQKDCGLVLAEPTQIHQIVMNLCTNAYHAMEETGGKLAITLKEVELAAKDFKDPAMIPGPHVCLTVADTGPGMEQNIIDRIFDPYFTTKEEGKGSGLGLAVIHGIVKNHGGDISVYSEPGKGAEFKVYLPVIKKQKETAKFETDTPIQKGTESILLVDDQDLIVDMERQMLERLGYHITARTSSIEALEAFRANPDKFDLVITDMTMPNMTGDKLAGEMIKIRTDIPIILCTGFSEMMSQEGAESLGLKGFLMKPVVLKELSSVIRKVLDG